MSIALGVKWSDGRYDVGPGASQATARLWASIARELGLPMLAEIAFNGWPIFGPHELESLTAEFETLRKQFDDAGCWEQIDRILIALNDLKGSEGWVGDFG